MVDSAPLVTVKDLPLTFTVKYLGHHPAKGIWGMKYTRKPVDNLVSQAKQLPGDVILPIVKMKVSRGGLAYVDITKKLEYKPVTFSVDVMSYGVQDLVYTRIFSMIVVTGNNLNNGTPFECHSFLCESREQATKLTYALAAAFQDYGQKLKETGSAERHVRKFAIDLRTPEDQLLQSSDEETEA